ncbi:hypothetical protein [Zymomonas mobilis]|uniref:hypothetical protein n=1 Tax=Zymomonas mobilis TaxID=542 RepID=UPI0039EAD6F2
MAIKITITDAGRAALINATQSGTRAVSIVSVGISGTSITADKSATVLPDEIKRISTISGKVTALDAIHLTAKDDGSDVYTIRSFALYLDDGTLFAIYGQSSPILEKSAAAMLLLQLDIRFVDIDATQIQFGNLDFINPASTEKTAGVTRLTELGEAEQSTENIAVSPVELRRFAEKLARVADVMASIQKLDEAKVNRGGDTMTGSLRVMQSLTVDQLISARTMLKLFSANGLNGFDLHSDDDGSARMYAKNGNVDYQPFLAFNPQGNLDFYSPTGQCLINGQLIWNKNNDGAGSGLDTDLFRGNAPEHFATADDRNNLQNQINNRILGDYGVLSGGLRGYSAYVYQNQLGFCARDDQGNDHWFHFRTSEDTQAALDTKFDKTGGQINGPITATGAIAAGQMMSAVWLLRLISGNGLNGLDLHTDDDGTVRMYAKNGNVDYQPFLAFNPQGNLDFYSPTGQCLINGQLIWNKNNDGAGSGLDTDLFRGNAPEHFATADDRNNLQSQINERILGDYGVLSGGQRGYGAYVYQNQLGFCARDDQGNDHWYHFRTSEDTQAALDTKFDKTGGQINGPISATGAISAGQMMSAVWLLRLISGNGLNGLDLHTDDDGTVRMYAKNGNVDYQEFLAFNPQGNIDFYSPTGQAFINGQQIWHRGNDGAGSGLDADFWRGLSPDYFAANSRIETSGVPNGLMKRIDDHVELHLKLDNVVGIINLPHTFNNIVDIQITTFRDTDSRPVWANVISHTNNSIYVSGNYMSHGNNQNADSCAGFIHVYGN